MSDLSIAYNLNPKQIYSQLKTDDYGLTDIEAKKRQNLFGKNIITIHQKRHPINILLSQFATNTAISSKRRIISGCRKNGSLAVFSSFLLQTARIIPLSFLYKLCTRFVAKSGLNCVTLAL